MAVFGVAITDKGSRSDNARYAQNNEREGNKYDQAVTYVTDQNTNFGGQVSTKCIFYNATGETLHYATLDCSYEGRIWDSYPLEVKNGQWGAFLHVGYPKPAATGSKAYVVYRVKANNNLHFCKTLIGWETPLNVSFDNDTHAFCAVHGDGYDIVKDDISKAISDNHKEADCVPFKGISMIAKIDPGNSPLLVVKFIIKNDD